MRWITGRRESTVAFEHLAITNIHADERSPHSLKAYSIMKRRYWNNWNKQSSRKIHRIVHAQKSKAQKDAKWIRFQKLHTSKPNRQWNKFYGTTRTEKPNSNFDMEVGYQIVQPSKFLHVATVSRLSPMEKLTDNSLIARLKCQNDPSTSSRKFTTTTTTKSLKPDSATESGAHMGTTMRLQQLTPKLESLCVANNLGSISLSADCKSQSTTRTTTYVAQTGGNDTTRMTEHQIPD